MIMKLKNWVVAYIFSIKINKILLITVSYPYGVGEQFLEKEIEFLSKKGVDITIYPSVIKGKARNIPDCVKIINFKM